MTDIKTKYNFIDWASYINNNYNLVYRCRDIYTVNDTKYIDYTIGIGNKADFIALFKEAQDKLVESLTNSTEGFITLTVANTDELISKFILSYNYLTDEGIEEITITIYEEH